MIDFTKPIAESNNFIVLDRYVKEWKVTDGFTPSMAAMVSFYNATRHLAQALWI